MKIYEKIKGLLKEKGWNASVFHRKIKDLFEDNAIAYLTLHRTINGVTKVRESTLFQIASVLGITPEEIKKNTEAQKKFNRYNYNKNAFLEVMDSCPDFLTARLVLLSNAKTQTEHDPLEKGNFTKWLYGLQGEMACIVMTENGVQKKIIKKNEAFYFKSTYPHYFENTSPNKAVCILIQNPKYI